MSIKVLKTVLPAALNQIRQGSTFLSVMGYTNNYEEVSNFGLVFHVDYLKAVRNAVNVWSIYKPRSELEKLAKRELLASFRDTLRGRSHSKSAHAYSKISDGDNFIINGVKYHDRLGIVHLTGFLVHKRILKEVMYPDTRSPYVVAKDRLRAMTKLSRFRQFKLTDETFKKITVDKLTFDQKDLLRC